MEVTQKVALVVGASRGIGRQIAIDLARNGYSVALGAKSVSDASQAFPFPPDPNSSASTVNTVAREIQELGGVAEAIQVDTRNSESIHLMLQKAVQINGRLDVLIYNSGAIWWASVQDTPLKRYKLMQEVNSEGLYATVQAALPYFEKGGWKGRIVVVSPPIYSRFFRGKTAYAMSKVAMSVLTKGLAMDFERQERRNMAISSIWPATAIESAATLQTTAQDEEQAKDLRKPTIFSDAILAMLNAPTTTINGQLTLDEDFLRSYTGMTDFSEYSVVNGCFPRRIMPKRFPNLEVEEQQDEGRRLDSRRLNQSKL